MAHNIKFYPVDNGDTVLISLSDNTTILIDCKMRTSAEDPEVTSQYDVKKDLLESLKRKNDNPILDVFILTHPDKDHCHGFDKHFYKGAPAQYRKENRENGEILIEEIWATSMLFNGATNADAKVLKEEAERRKKLWDLNDPEKNKAGNRIRMIGYDGDSRFENLPTNVPGDTVNEINASLKDTFEFFVHSPFKKTLIEATSEIDKNYSSIVLQARFKTSLSDSDFKYFVLIGGDADHYNWEEIYKKSEKHDNLDKLKWDIFVAPHHCSWTYFNDVPYGKTNESKIPKETSLKVLDQKTTNGKIIASCKIIKNNEDNPPHYNAKQEYLKKLDNDSDFLNTSVEPTKEKPEPIVFEFKSERIEKQKTIYEKLESANKVLINSPIKQPWHE